MEEILGLLTEGETLLLNEMHCDIERKKYQVFLLNKYSVDNLEVGGMSDLENGLFDKDTYTSDVQIYQGNITESLKGKFNIQVCQMIMNVLVDALAILEVPNPERKLNKVMIVQDVSKDLAPDDFRLYYYYNDTKLATVYRHDKIYIIQEVGLKK
jgi:hypothetical protein